METQREQEIEIVWNDDGTITVELTRDVAAEIICSLWQSVWADIRMSELQRTGRLCLGDCMLRLDDGVFQMYGFPDAVVYRLRQVGDLTQIH